MWILASITAGAVGLAFFLLIVGVFGLDLAIGALVLFVVGAISLMFATRGRQV